VPFRQPEIKLKQPDFPHGTMRLPAWRKTTMSLSYSSARTYNNNRNYEWHAIRAIQRHTGMITGSGAFDNNTILAIYKWQGSPDRITTLKQDGKFGPASLGCMIAELKRGNFSTEMAQLMPYPHTLPGSKGPDGTVIVPTFLVSQLQSLDLRADGTGWQFRGRFRVDIHLNPSLADPARYEYRQHIKGTATSTPGRFKSGIRILANWESTGPAVSHGSQFQVPGGLHATTWREDGAATLGGTRKYGYRHQPALNIIGEEDRYLPDQKDGRHYVCVDTYGVMGSKRVMGTRLQLKLNYKGQIIDKLVSDRVVIEKTWSYSGDDVFAV
jgi:hypothetical protein